MLIHMIYLKKYKLYETPITLEWSSRQVLNFMDSPINFQAYRMEKSKSQIPNTTLQRTQQVHESPMSGLSKKEALSLDQWVLPALDKTRQDKTNLEELFCHPYNFSSNQQPCSEFGSKDSPCTLVCLIDEQGLINAQGGIYHKN